MGRTSPFTEAELRALIQEDRQVELDDHLIELIYQAGWTDLEMALRVQSAARKTTAGALKLTTILVDRGGGHVDACVSPAGHRDSHASKLIRGKYVGDGD